MALTLETDVSCQDCLQQGQSAQVISIYGVEGLPQAVSAATLCKLLDKRYGRPSTSLNVISAKPALIP